MKPLRGLVGFVAFCVACLAAAWWLAGGFRPHRGRLVAAADGAVLLARLDQVAAEVARRSTAANVALYPATVEEVVEELARDRLFGSFAVRGADGRTERLRSLLACCMPCDAERFVCWDLPHVPPTGSPVRLRMIAFENATATTPETVAEFVFENRLGVGRHAVVLPEAFRELDLIQLYGDAGTWSAERASSSTGPLCIFRFRPRQGTLDILPMRFWNECRHRPSERLEQLFYDAERGLFYGFGDRYPPSVVSGDARSVRQLRGMPRRRFFMSD
ncbi:MAG TPA: hypothetical protein VEI02_11125 [Planctomycetota bacterium]|nr:hypothetical protein [Planctomycetota bacterium]